MADVSVQRAMRVLAAVPRHAKVAFRSVLDVVRYPIAVAVCGALIWGSYWVISEAYRGGGFVSFTAAVFATLLTAMFLLFWGALVASAWRGKPVVQARESESRRAALVREFSFATYVLVWGLCAFSCLAFVLVDQGWLDVSSSTRAPLDDYVATFQVFLWHLLDVIPLAGVNDALAWKEPGSRRDLAAGFLILSFKIMVLIPVIAAITGVFARRNT